MNKADHEIMAQEWALVDENPDVLNAKIDELIESLENGEEENQIDIDNVYSNGGDDCVDTNNDNDDINITKQEEKVCFLEAEACLMKVTEHIRSSGLPKKHIDEFFRLQRILRSHNASRPRVTPTINTYFKTVSNEQNKK